MLSNLNFRFTFLTLALAFIFACSSMPQVTELDPRSDPQIEIERVQGQLKQAKLNQVDVLSPKNYELATENLNKAIKSRSQNENQLTILHHIAVSQTYIDLAKKTSDVSRQLLSGTIRARQEALEARAPVYATEDLRQADLNLKAMTEKIENNDTSMTESKSEKLEASYHEIELNSIKKEKLGPAQELIQQATREGALKLTPETLDWANQQLEKEKLIITNQRHDLVAVNKSSANAKSAAVRLLKMVRLAKSSTANKPEDIAMQLEKKDLAIVQAESQLDQSQVNLEKSENELSHQKNENQKLESEAWLNNEFEAARKEFTQDEAEVYKQGDQLLLRLKGLSFSQNTSAISSKNFKLLAKVEKVIGDIGQSHILIEGHTDSLGSKKLNESLSLQRAQSVQSYFIANKKISESQITSEGFGDTKPISTNKTALGRAQNRRVDVIISADQIVQ